MTRHRTRPRPTQQPIEDPAQDQVDKQAAQLVALLRILPNAIARDSAMQRSGGRHATGGTKSPAAPVNLNVVSTRTRIERRLRAVEADAVTELGLGDYRRRELLDIAANLPEWHRASADDHLGKMIHRKLEGWINDLERAIGLRMPDESLGLLCPDHRKTHPTELKVKGSHAELADTLITGPPPRLYPITVGPTCPIDTCEHTSCAILHHGLHIVGVDPPSDDPYFADLPALRILDDRGEATDWVYVGGSDEPTWFAFNGEPAYVWKASGEIRCTFKHCRRTWTSTSERRFLARVLGSLDQLTQQQKQAIAGIS